MVAARPLLQNFLNELLAEQGRLQTPVARFSTAPSPAGRVPVYRDLIPLSRPGPGEQYAFEVDLDSCSGCKACVVACHSLNGLEEDESWRDVGLVRGGSPAAPYQQTVTTACHHCADPGCLNGCPVLAYEKDPVTGIVRHLDDQCIGCQYCILKCPYDVPKYSERLGIVRKCDMCHDRLAGGEAPACVQACPTQAITIVKVQTHVGGILRPDTSRFLATAPDPAHTLPTTRYLSRRPIPSNLVAADAATLRPQPPHWPLVVMLTLTQMAVGCCTAATLCRSALIFDGVVPGMEPGLQLVRIGWLAGALGLAASFFHLGQPLRAWRIFLGWRRSWLSREAMVFVAWFALASATVLYPALVAAGALLGVLGLFCSVMIYADTHREFWRFPNTAARFFGSAFVLGLATTLAVAPSVPVALALLLATFVKLAGEVRATLPLNHSAAEDDAPAPALKTARLLAGPLRPVFGLRALFGLTGGILLPLALAAHAVPAGMAWLALASALLGELAERHLFFRAVVAPKMPGLPSVALAKGGVLRT